MVSTYTHARAHFASLCDEAVNSHEPVFITRRKARPVAIVAADELESLMETAHLMRSPKNAQRLLTALQRAHKKETPAGSVKTLRREFGLDG